MQSTQIYLHFFLTLTSSLQFLLGDGFLGEEEIGEEDEDEHDSGDSEGNQKRQLHVRSVLYLDDFLAYLLQNGDLCRNKVNKFSVSEISAHQRSNNSTNRGTNEQERRSEGYILLIGHFSQDRLGNTQKTIRQTVNQTNDNTEIVVLAESQTSNTHNVHYNDNT